MLPLLGFRVNIPHRASGLFLFPFWVLSFVSQYQEMSAQHHDTPRSTRAKFPDVLVVCRKPRHSKKKRGQASGRAVPSSPWLPLSPLNGRGRRDGVFPSPRLPRTRWVSHDGLEEPTASMHRARGRTTLCSNRHPRVLASCCCAAWVWDCSFAPEHLS